MHEVFISYSRKDKAFVRRLEAELKARGREAWVDWEGIQPTEEFMRAIFRAIEGADTFAFILSPDSIASRVCGREIAHAAALNKRMVPIVAREVKSGLVPEPLAKLNWILFRESDDFEQAAELLVRALETDLEWVHAHTRLLTRALEWAANRRSTSFVLRREDLRAAEQWLAQAGSEKERQPTQLQTEFIIASRKAESKRQRIILGAVSVGAIVAVVLAIFALLARNRAETERRNAEAATKRATHARDEAGKLIEFMSFNLRDAVQPIGRTDLLAAVNLKVREFYDSFRDEDESSELLRQKGALLNNEANVARARGNLPQALQGFQAGVAFFKEQIKRDSSDLNWSRDLSTSLEGVADILHTNGDLAGAFENQRESVALMEKLSQLKPDEKILADELGSSYVNLGDLQRDGGEPAAALKSYRDALAISEKLATSAPENASWQRNLSLRYGRVADAENAKGNHAGARSNYQRSLEVAQKLAVANPNNAGWQSDLLGARMKLGDFLWAQNETASAASEFGAAIPIAEKLRQLDPADVDWARDLSICYNQIGTVQLAQGEDEGALKNFQASKALREELVLQQPEKILAQRDLAICEQNIGDAFLAGRKFSDALAAYQRGLALSEEVARRDRIDPRWKRDLAIAHAKIGDARFGAGDFPAAEEDYEEAASLAETLVTLDDIATLEAFALNCEKLARAELPQGKSAAALANFRRALQAQEKLSASSLDDATRENELAEIYVFTGMTQAMVEGESADEARALMEKARDLLQRLKNQNQLFGDRAELLERVEQALAVTAKASAPASKRKRR